MVIESVVVLTRPKKNGFGTHWGVEFPGGVVVDYVLGIGLRVTNRRDFADGLPVTVLRRVPWHLTGAVRARLNDVIRNPKKYDLLQWNCETFAEWLTRGEAHSNQVTAALLLVGLFAVVAVAWR